MGGGSGAGSCRDVGDVGVHQKDGRWLEEGEEKKHLTRGFEGSGCAPFEEW